MLVENDLVMAPEFKLELLEVGANAMDIVILAKDGEEQDKHRELWIDLGEVVVAAFIHKDQVIAKC